MSNHNIILGTVGTKKVELAKAIGKDFMINYDLSDLVNTENPKDVLIKIDYLLENMEFDKNYTIGSHIELLAYADILKTNEEITFSEFNKVYKKVLAYFENNKFNYIILILCKKGTDQLSINLHYEICKYLHALTGNYTFHDGYIEVEDISGESNASYLKQFKID
jgi:hypothetical protein